MGKFAEFCKGKTMGAFFPLLLATNQILCHHALMPLRHGICEERAAATYDIIGVHKQ